ncbi:heme peroxidase, partial [Tribonema minus]
MVYWGLFVYHDMFDTFDAVGAPEQIPCDDGVADLQCPNVNECAANPLIQAETIPVPPTRKDPKTGLALNAATAFMDLDGIYGRTQAVADSLRTFTDGKMKLAPSGLPLFDAATNTYLIADQRNAQLPGTLALHALLLREHNWRAGNLTGPVTIDGTPYARYVDYVEDWLGCTPIPCTKRGGVGMLALTVPVTIDGTPYARYVDYVEDWLGCTPIPRTKAARQWTIAAAQHITLHEYIPRLLGLPSSLEASNSYSAAAPADPSVSIAAAVALRWPYFGFGPVDRVLDEAWQTVPDHDYRPVGTVCGPAAVAALINDVGIEAIMRGMMLADASAVDASLPPYSDTLTCMGQPVLDVQTTRDMG